MAALALGAAACGGVVDWLAGGYQPTDAPALPAYLVVEAAPAADQAQSASIGTLVYVQATGGQRLAIQTLNGNFIGLGQNVSTDFGCYPIVPEAPNLTPITVIPAQSSEALLFVALLADDATQDASASASEAGDAGSTLTCSAAPAFTSGSCPCGADSHVILETAAVISNGLVTPIDAGPPASLLDASSPDGAIADVLDSGPGLGNASDDVGADHSDDATPQVDARDEPSGEGPDATD